MNKPMTKEERKAAKAEMRAAKEEAFRQPRFLVSKQELSALASIGPITLALLYTLYVIMDSVLPPATSATPLWLAFFRQATVFTPAAVVLFWGYQFLTQRFPQWLKSREIPASESGKTGLAEAPAAPETGRG